MTSEQNDDAGACRCAHNTSLATQTEKPTGKCSTAPAVTQCAVDPCGEAGARPCSARAGTTLGCGGAVKPVVTTTCEKPDGRRGRSRERETSGGASCSPADRGRSPGGVMNVCEKPGDGHGCAANARPCSRRPCSRRSDTCGRPWSCNMNVCVKLNDDDCGGYALTPYGQQFAVCTERVIKRCACVKFNGLQDSCKHPGCCIRRGCLDKPFPTCPPARQWRFGICCKDKMKKICNPDCN